MRPMKASFSLSFLILCVSLPAIADTFHGPIGLQLYSLRADFDRDVEGTLKKVKSFGIKNVELAGTYNLSPEKFKALLDANGLKPISGHFPFERYRDDI